MQTTLDKTTPPIETVLYAVMGGIFAIKLDNPENRAGYRSGYVLDKNGTVIGSASDYIYDGRGFAVHTKSFGGFVPISCVEFVS